MSKYISLENLERYDSKMQEHFASFCASKEDGMWRQTEKAGAVSFWPVGNSPLEGTVDFMFTETPPASGTKSPDNPSTISGISSVKVTRCGDNILPSNRKSNYSGEAGTFSTDADGYVSYSAMSDGRAFVYSVCNAQVYLHAGQQYVLHTEVKTAATSSYRTIKILDEYNTAVLTASPGDSDNSHTFTPPHDGMYGVIYKIYDGTYRFSLYLGSTVASFEPYAGADYTIQLGNTYYGGSIDLATGLMTVTWHYALVDPATMTYQVFLEYVGTNCAGISINPQSLSGNKGKAKGYKSAYSNRFATTNDSTYTVDKEMCYTTNGSTGIVFKMNKSRFPDGTDFTSIASIAAGFNTWLASNPTYVAFKLATPYTVQLTPPQILSLLQPDKYVPRLNTVYSDAEAVQIVYQKNPVRDKFEKVQAIIAQGGNV